ncbi:alpha/beta hydrolase [Streptomyces sp. HNM0574]|uniref:alpha/beta fold hydrolase n=1 Tax=Streptomyces sp. HNM0574 TaxID=2714954 RepID=UPI00146CF50A|nr:alpha/beta hydrolase [Streptomyces sp. HNM0574]NLU66285.1 alpha/beta hydrolase [Streptomyces sp. HNM0574]
MKKALTGVAALALATTAAVGLTGSTAAVADKRPEPVVQDEFDALGPAMHELERDGRTVHFSDTGTQEGRPVVFMGGTGTTARASGMTEFLRTTRENLDLRIISVERNGFGDTEYDPELGFDDYSQDVEAVLDRLGIERAPVVAISGGGPYAAHFAERAPERISSLHLAAAAPPYGATSPFCALGEDAQRKQVAEQIRDPRAWWGFEKDSPVHGIPGFTDNAEEDGGRSYYLRGQKGDPSAQVHEQRLYCERPGPGLSGLKAPAYLYTGMKDKTVPPAVQAEWKKALPGEPTVRKYADSGHDVQYRHWDQILLDLAGYADRTVVCADGRTQVPPAARAAKLLKNGATTGSCAWRD